MSGGESLQVRLHREVVGSLSSASIFESGSRSCLKPKIGRSTISQAKSPTSDDPIARQLLSETRPWSSLPQRTSRFRVSYKCCGTSNEFQLKKFQQEQRGQVKILSQYMEFCWKIMVGTVIGFFGAALRSIGGVSEGGIFVPMPALIIEFDPKTSTAISKFERLFSKSINKSPNYVQGMLLKKMSIHRGFSTCPLIEHLTFDTVSQQLRLKITMSNTLNTR
ncbi:elongation factor G [Striga asiatica]|uniref:Elongation factor G n=1 Tax=Striga asiatica TaxID=4170 RepID=A0A5A7R8C7_STRAF|nr:elongation factor G [Striga asiatica]